MGIFTKRDLYNIFFREKERNSLFTTTLDRYKANNGLV